MMIFEDKTTACINTKYMSPSLKKSLDGSAQEKVNKRDVSGKMDVKMFISTLRVCCLWLVNLPPQRALLEIRPY